MTITTTKKKLIGMSKYYLEKMQSIFFWIGCIIGVLFPGCLKYYVRVHIVDIESINIILKVGREAPTTTTRFYFLSTVGENFA